MTWAPWVLVICAAGALVCVLYGVIRAAVAARTVKAHADRLKELPVLAQAAQADVYAQRINDDVAQIDGLLVRANLAIQSINASIQKMRIPEAIAALRTAGAAIRLLASSFSAR